MFVRFAVLAAVTAIALSGAAAPSLAGPVPPASEPNVANVSNVALNRHLATLAASPSRQRPPSGVAAAGFGLNTGPKTSPSMILSPAILSIVSRFTKAEHLLHFKSHGLDANLWGALNGGPGVKIRYSIKF
jgi:hypothetical protein